ncbi:MAG TPA: FkbM family methyltransferase, partial [Bdellovibrionales bacterium]|nr:FkbM family methyltransferase [Bdellovibrionales bacterium]
EHIDFLSVDVEGLDALILKSNDWSRFRPSAVVFERHGVSKEEPLKDELVRFLKERGYEIVGMTGPSIVMGNNTYASAKI